MDAHFTDTDLQSQLITPDAAPVAQAAGSPPPKKPSPKKGTKKSSKKSKPSNPLAESILKRRMEITGVLMLLASVLCLVALFAYNMEDDATIENISVLEFFSETARLISAQIKNPLGLIGAKLSGFLIKAILGYPTAILLGLSACWGWFLLRRKSFDRAMYVTVYGIGFAILFAAMFGLTEASFSEVMSGAIGRLIATVLKTVVGSFGAWCVLSVLMLLVLALFIDLDIQKTIDRLTFITRDKAATTAQRFQEWYAERKAARELERQQIEAELAAEAALEQSKSDDDTADENVQPEIASPKDNSSKEISSKEISSKEISSKDTSSKDTSSKDVSQKEVSRVTPQLATNTSDTATLNPVPVQNDASFAEKLHAIQAELAKTEQPKSEPVSTSTAALSASAAAPVTLTTAAGTTHAASAGILNSATFQSVTDSLSVAAPLAEKPVEKLADEKTSVEKSIDSIIDKELEKLLDKAEADAEAKEAMDMFSDAPLISAKPIEIDETLLDIEPLPFRAAPAPVEAPRPVNKNHEPIHDDVLDNLVDELVGKKQPTSKPADKDEVSAAEPSVLLKESVREAEADLDERDLEVSTKEQIAYQFPSVDLLTAPEVEGDAVSLEELEETKRKLLEKLRIYKIEVIRVEATVGPRVTLFELELAPDVKVSRITALEDDLAMAMAARGIRIIAPIPGKNAVGIEIPNLKSKVVRIKSLLQSEKFKNFKGTLPVAFGKTISNEIYIDDLAKMPHLLVAGATGSGKSVGINTILTSLIYFCSPEKVKFLLIDPKRVELFPYQKLKNHFLVKYKDLEEQIITDTSKAVYALKSVEKEMDLRYDKLARVGVRNIQGYNQKFPDDELAYIVVVIDELADMMITAGRDVEEPIARLAQLARAVGIHLVVATQRPSVDVITGVIKANFPARVAYQVASKVDSRTILDSVGADQLLGYGDMLYQPASEPKPIRIQNALVSTEEVEAITEFIFSQKGFTEPFELPAPDLKLTSSKADDDDDDSGFSERDKMFKEAAELVVRHQQGSVSLLQRRLKLGFGRAARIMDQLEQAGIVGPPDGSKPREVLAQSEESLSLLLNNLD
jgi:DNA segregation ATPase FtsK/SpoIIIE, S-DNA-T family